MGEEGKKEVALAVWRRAEQPLQPELAQRPEHSRHMPVRKRALDPERHTPQKQRLPPQHPPHRLDRLRRQPRDVGDRLLAHPLALADAAAHQLRLVHTLAMAPPDRVHVHRHTLPRHERDYDTPIGQTLDYKTKRKRRPNPHQQRARTALSSKTSG